MLTSAAVSIGTNLAEIAATNEIKLVPKQSTLMQELVVAISNNMFSKIEKRGYIEPTILQASAGTDTISKNVKSYTSSSHDTLMDNYQVDLASIVSNHLGFARTVVNKEINLLKESIAEGLASCKYKEAEDFFSITYFKIADVFSSYIIENEISNYKNSNAKYFFDSVNLNTLSNDGFDLCSYILTGDEEQDSLINSWCAGIGKDKLLSYIVDEVPEYALAVNNLMDYSLVNYLFYRNLLNKADLNLGLSSVQLKSKAVANRDYFGNKLAVALDMYRKEIKSGRLLTSDSEAAFSYFNDKSLAITIYEENFAKLAEVGCSIEVLFGFISSENRNTVTISELTAKKDVYLNKWNSTKSLYLISINNNKLEIFKQILCNKFDQSLVGLTDEEKEVSNNSQHFNKETKEMGYKYIDSLQLSEIDDLDKIALDLIAQIRFRFSNAYVLLSGMAEILKMSDNITPMEAALYSAVQYVTDYLVQQVDVVKV